MKRVALLIALALSGAAFSAQAPIRQALLVGIDKYPVVPASKRHKGAANDVRMMTILLDGYGFKCQPLLQEQATQASILKALDELQASAGKGSHVVLYFSGRGSMAPLAEGEDLEPTLAPYDVLATDAKNDVRMSRIEGFAKHLKDNGAEVTIVVDACYRYPRTASRSQYRHYDDETKAINRSGNIRNELYRGPGTFLAASGTKGNAYEWRRDFNTDSWMGAFTDELTYLASPIEGRAPSAADVLTEVQASFQEKVQQGYMPGFVPYPTSNQMEERSGEYRRPIFAGSGSSGGTRPPSATRPGGDRLKVGLDLDYAITGSEREKLATTLLPTVQKQMEAAFKGMPNAVLVPQFGGDVDRMIFVSPSPNGISMRMQSDEVDRKIFQSLSGKDVPAVMKAGLANYLERLVLIQRLFSLKDKEDGDLKAEWKFASDKPEYRVGENLTLSMSSPVEGRLYLLDRDLADGLVQLAVPSDWAMNNLLPKAGSGWGQDLRTRIQPGTPPGQMRVKAILVVTAEELPPLRADAAGYYTNELKHLQALVKLLESGKARWAAQDFYINIVE